MRRTHALLAVLALFSAAADAGAAEHFLQEKGRFAGEASPLASDAVDKAAVVQTLGARATATSTATVYGGFTLTSPTTVYILVRGNSLGTLGVTQNYLDIPRLRLYNSAGTDLVFDNAGRPGFNRCTAPTDSAVINYYTARGQAPSSNDACIGANFTAGTFTFTVTPTNIAGAVNSVPQFGDVLFEVILGP
jgi:hypothetical protein